MSSRKCILRGRLGSAYGQLAVQQLMIMVSWLQHS